MASIAPPPPHQHPSIAINIPPHGAGHSGAGNGGAKIGRPPQWTESKSRKLARLYVYTVLPVDKIIKAVFGEESVKYVFS